MKLFTRQWLWPAVLVCASQTVFGLQAPYLYDAVSMGDTAVQLTWRNNSADYIGIIILRKSGFADQLNPIDTTSGNALSFFDHSVTASTEPYTYALCAYSQNEHSDTSNVDSVTIEQKQPPVPLLSKPMMLSASWDTLKHAIELKFYDTSAAITGFKVYRATNFGSFYMIQNIDSFKPKQWVYYVDSSFLPNTWYKYYVAVYNSQQEQNSDCDSTFTVDLTAMAGDVPRKCTVVNKISGFPLNYNNWCMKFGDSIVLNETNSPPLSFTIIDVSNPALPKFAGLGSSDAAGLSSPCLSRKNFVLGMLGGKMKRYEYDGGNTVNLTAEGSLPSRYPYNTNQNPQSYPGFLSDSTFVAQYPITIAGPCYSNVLAKFLFTRNAISFAEDVPDLSLDCRGGYGNQAMNGKTFKGRYFANLGLSGIPGDTIEIMDFNLPQRPRCYAHLSQFQGAFPWMEDNILIDTQVTKNARNIFVDTIKNLIFIVSSSELSIYNSRTETGVVPAETQKSQPLKSLRVAGLPNSGTIVIFLPRHSQAASVAIFDLSGKQLQHFENIRNDFITWKKQSRTGMYLIKAIINRITLTSKIVLP
jgi:hypothetical protein